MDRARPRLFTYGPAGCSDKRRPRQKRKNAKAPSGLFEDLLVGKPPWPRVMHSSRALIYYSFSVEYSISGSATTTLLTVIPLIVHPPRHVPLLIYRGEPHNPRTGSA